jgi:prolyl 4-hydroxylase
LDAIGRYLGLKGLVAYHLTFIGVSYSEKGYIHHDSTNTGASVYNVIIPLILEEGSGPELAMEVDDGSRAGSLKYKIGMGALMGDDAMHGTEACDYREKKGMRLAATVYIADINRENARDIASQTLTQIYPLPDTTWLLSQAGRHWGDENDNSLKHDKGRKQFLFHDRVMNCQELVEKGMCETAGPTEESKRTREKCMKTCRVYDETLNAKSHTEELEGGSSKLDVFFGELGDDPSCVDVSPDCPHLASLGTCMSDPTAMKQQGCHWSCMYCLTPDTAEIFDLGEEQIFEEEGRDPNALPSEEEISAVIADTEEYVINEVLVFDEYEHVRGFCTNNLRECSLWAAEGECDKNYGWMRKNCPAACQDCLMADPNKRCPVDYESSVFHSGGIGGMFERWLEEAGEDVAAFSQDNLPRGGTHPLGKLTVLTSPYHDMMPLLNDEDKQIAHEFSPLPWVVQIDDFLSEEECQRLIELGADKNERSMEDARTSFAIDEQNDVVSDRRTSTNTWCQDECRDNPIVQHVMERMVNMTGIPDGNMEHLQLVRYKSGQYYREHHDFSPAHTGTQYGPRILTFFLYLNDDGLEGGGTSFSGLDLVVQPKRGSALVWPSVTNENPEERDEWTYHEALPVITGEKYGANAWCVQSGRLADFTVV